MATFVLISGVGRLIAEAKVTPIVIPFWHEGNYIPSYKANPSFFLNEWLCSELWFIGESIMPHAKRTRQVLLLLAITTLTIITLPVCCQ